MTGGRRYLVNVAVGFSLVMAGIFLAELIPHPKAMYGLVLAVCMIPAGIFVKIRLPMDDVSVVGIVVGMIVLGVYLTAMMWFLAEKMNVPLRYASWITVVPALLFTDIRRRMKKKT